MGRLSKDSHFHDSVPAQSFASETLFSILGSLTELVDNLISEIYPIISDRYSCK
jgi:hypothetical protein